MFDKSTYEAAHNAVDCAYVQNEQVEELLDMLNYEQQEDYELSDESKAVNSIVDVMEELNRFAMATADLDIDTEWLANTVRVIRMFRVELDVTLNGYAYPKKSEEDMMKQEEYDNLVKSLERHRQDMISDPDQWRD